MNDQTLADMKVMQQMMEDLAFCIGQLQQNSSPQLIPPTNEQNPINQGNSNTQGKGRGFHKGRRG